VGGLAARRGGEEFCENSLDGLEPDAQTEGWMRVTHGPDSLELSLQPRPTRFIGASILPGVSGASRCPFGAAGEYAASWVPEKVR
jgi:hypothetical protein